VRRPAAVSVARLDDGRMPSDVVMTPPTTVVSNFSSVAGSK
jgi:hypothetical protein